MFAQTCLNKSVLVQTALNKCVTCVLAQACLNKIVAAQTCVNKCVLAHTCPNIMCICIRIAFVFVFVITSVCASCLLWSVIFEIYTLRITRMVNSAPGEKLARPECAIW